MRLNKRKVINYLKQKMKEIDNGDFYEFQSEWNALNNAVKVLENFEYLWLQKTN